MHADLAGIALNLLALLAAGIYVSSLTNARSVSNVDHRLAALFAVLAVLVGVRALRWWLEFEALHRIEEALAALMPLFALFLAEGLLRRHAPAWLKRLICFGSLLVAFAAIARPVSLAQPFVYVLGAYVSLSLASLAILLAVREKASLARAENDAISALFVGLLLALPLSATDFLAAGGVSPIHAGGLGLLFFLLAVTRVTAVGGGGLEVLSEVFWALAASALAFAAFAFVFGSPAPLEAINVAALILGLALTFRVIQHQIESRRTRERASLWRTLAGAPTANLEIFLDGLLAAPELKGARLAEAEALIAYDSDALQAAFAVSPVTTRESAQTHEQLSILFDENEATHAILVARAPMRILFVNLPKLGAGADTELQLTVLAKLAQGAAHA